MVFRVLRMSDVIVTFKIMPTGVDINLDDLEKKIKSSINPTRMSREPVAFGLVAIVATILVEDAEGQMDSAETKLRSIEGVNDVQVTEITRTI